MFSQRGWEWGLGCERPKAGCGLTWMGPESTGVSGLRDDITPNALKEAPGLGPEAKLDLREGEGLERCGQTQGLESGR